jgi:NAD(P)-dependent dehydrogenase (short-subunit alcohol dehydrogenase family)
MLRTYKGAVAIVTGGASGIGRALGEALARRGATVVLADLQIELARTVAASINADGGTASAAEADVTDFAAMDRLVRDAVRSHGRLDYMFNNAGIGIGGEVRHYGIDDWNRVFDVNLRGVANGVQAAYQLMLEQGFGHIVNTASMAGLMPTPGTTSYGATKAAVVGLSTALRIEAARFGVRVSVICPGVIQTPVLEDCGKYGKMLIDIPIELQRQYWQSLRPMQPDVFAPKVLRALAKNKAIIIVPGWWKLIWWLNRLSPAAGMWFSRKLFEWGQRKLERFPARTEPQPSLKTASRADSPTHPADQATEAIHIPKGFQPSASQPATRAPDGR